MVLDKSQGKCKAVAYLPMKAVGGKENLYQRMCIKTELQCDNSRACKTGNTVSDRIQIRMLRKDQRKAI